MTATHKVVMVGFTGAVICALIAGVCSILPGLVKNMLDAQ